MPGRQGLAKQVVPMLNGQQITELREQADKMYPFSRIRQEFMDAAKQGEHALHQREADEAARQAEQSRRAAQVQQSQQRAQQSAPRPGRRY